MAEPAMRVALLARAGAACDNLQAALRHAGADVVAVQDPGDGDPAALAAARPAAVLVALEPAIEDALERYDAVLSEPGRLVVYDEVAVAARREGWDAARWARHLAAKLGGHADVLPPGAGIDDDPAGFAAPRPRVAAPVAVPSAAAQPAVAPAPTPAPAHASFDADAVHLGIESAHEEVLAKAGDGIDFGGFTPEMAAAMATGPMAAPPPPPLPQDRFAAVDATAGDEATDEAPVEPAVEAAPAQEAAPEPMPATTGTVAATAADANVLEWEVVAPGPVPPRPAVQPAAAEAEPAAPVRLSAAEMTLVDMESPGEAGGAGPAPFVNPVAGGGVVVLAGIGGPDAVRQFLGALPTDFPRPIVVRQRLDGGRHDRLVRQMQRATALPVELAEAGRLLVGGHVYILPDGMTTSGEGASRFVQTDLAVPMLAGLPAAQSAVLVLSGSDPAAVPQMMEAAREGAYVAGQSPEDSFDGAAAAALVAAGGESCTAVELAQRVGARWQS